MATGKPQYKDCSDEELLALYRSTHSTTCLGELLQRYTLLLLGVCMKYLRQEDEARDAVQHVFTKVIGEVDKYKVTYFKSWIYTIARNHCLYLLRQRQTALPDSYLDDYAGDESLDIHHALQSAKDKDTMLQWLEEALHQLPPHQQQCVSLFYLHKKSYRQISDMVGYNMLQVKSYIQNGKRNIKMWIEEKIKENEA